MSVLYTVYLEDDAKNDLRTIRMYIAETLREPQIANKLYARIKKEIQSLSQLPERIKLVDDEPWHSRGFRKLLVENYMAFFICNENTVHVIRILYGGMDFTRQLKD